MFITLLSENVELIYVGLHHILDLHFQRRHITGAGTYSTDPAKAVPLFEVVRLAM